MKRKLPQTRSCFVCGLLNPVGLKLGFELEDGVVSARYLPRVEHAGFHDTIHGGIISTVLDEIMVWAIGTQHHKFAYCVELNVRFVSPVRPGVEVLAVGGPVVNRRNRLFEATGQILNQERQVLAEATGKYIPIKDTATALAMADFVGDASELFQEASAIPRT